MCEHMQAVRDGQIKRLLITVPPRSLKSSIVSVAFPAWWWIDDPSEQILCVSYADSLATRLSTQCRRLIESTLYEDLFGDIVELSDDQNTKHEFDTTAGGKRTALGIDGATTGGGADVLLYDDLHNTKQAYSKPALENVQEWWRDVMPSRMNNPKTAVQVCAMQRVNREDIAGTMIEQGWFELRIPLHFDPDRVFVSPIGWYDPRTEPGQLMHPERMGPDELKTLEAQAKSANMQAQYEQNPKSNKGKILQREWFKRYKDLPPLRAFDLIISCWDCASKAKEENDWTVGGVFGLLQNNYYALDIVRGHWTLREMVYWYDALNDKYRRFLSASYIEDKAAGPQFQQTLAENFPGIMEWSPGTRDKVTRVRSIEPYICSGNFWVPEDEDEDRPWVIPYLDELCEFPGAHDDQVDVTVMGIQELRGSETLTFAGRVR